MENLNYGPIIQIEGCAEGYLVVWHKCPRNLLDELSAQIFGYKDDPRAVFICITIEHVKERTEWIFAEWR